MQYSPSPALSVCVQVMYMKREPKSDSMNRNLEMSIQHDNVTMPHV